MKVLLLLCLIGIAMAFPMEKVPVSSNINNYQASPSNPSPPPQYTEQNPKPSVSKKGPKPQGQLSFSELMSDFLHKPLPFKAAQKDRKSG